MNKWIVSSSPHVHSGDSIQKNMLYVVLALLPAYLVALYYFGVGALVVSTIAIASCIAAEAFIQRFVLKTKVSISDGSAALTGLLLAMNLPANLPWWMVIIGSIVAIGLGKMCYGGLGNNLFNPALVGRVFLLISFPAAMTTWPIAEPFTTAYMDAQTAATPLSFMKFDQMLPPIWSTIIGGEGGSMGEVSAIALLLGGLFLLWKKVITWHIPVSILATVAIFTGIMHLVNPMMYENPLWHLCAGGLLLGAIFMATDYVTSPMTTRGQLLYGFGIGLITVVIRLWGSYPEGVSFAILLMNAATPLIDKYIQPKRFAKS
ncbi:MAG: RnfABCDGE type electron transport complex subunit D [Paludibacteraceae bacterium]|nr:RnfABCDGE type electron transport complex subunit D [Paludibacteraceae bacterium]